MFKDLNNKEDNSNNKSRSGLAAAFVAGGQDGALKWLVESGATVCVFLISGVKFECRLTNYDSYTIGISDIKGNQQLIYKDKISTISLKQPVAEH
ncbi:MAG: RNA chaperone Hfq [Succinivibrio sp.]|nr:RNA chaperone Hfq [Succinivibrio sp.]